jgi:hypothetical protein
VVPLFFKSFHFWESYNFLKFSLNTFYSWLQSLQNNSHNCFVDFLAEVDLAQTSEEDERLANKLFEGGDATAKGLVEVLDKIKKPDQLPLYYSGGMRILAKTIVSRKYWLDSRSAEGGQRKSVSPKNSKNKRIFEALWTEDTVLRLLESCF